MLFITREKWLAAAENIFRGEKIEHLSLQN